jgi:hypothetical protein
MMMIMPPDVLFSRASSFLFQPSSEMKGFTILLPSGDKKLNTKGFSNSIVLAFYLSSTSHKWSDERGKLSFCFNDGNLAFK